MAETIQEPSLTEQHTKPSTENFHATFHGVNVFFKLIKLKNSCFLWIGDDAKRMDCLSVKLEHKISIERHRVRWIDWLISLSA